MQNHASTLAAEFKLDAARVAATVALIDEGNTIPFIARYRKEATGSMDDQTLRALDERLSYLRKLDDQKETVHNSITEQGAMTPEIAAALEKAKTLAEVEDIYRPYKPKRKTRASIARARGLEPLAARLLEQRPEDEPALLARQYITEEVPDTEAALAGARDILAEGFSDSANLRATLRSLYNATALVESKAAKKDTDSVYSGYYDYSEPAAKMAGHRILAVDRGEREGFLEGERHRGCRTGRAAAYRAHGEERFPQRRAGARRRRGRLCAPYTPQPGAGGARGPDGARLRGSHQRIQQKPAAAFAAAAHQGEGGPRA